MQDTVSVAQRSVELAGGLQEKWRGQGMVTTVTLGLS